MALLEIENETVDSSSSLIISDHVNEKYNGEHRIQSSQINGKDWYPIQIIVGCISIMQMMEVPFMEFR